MKIMIKKLFFLLFIHTNIICLSLIESARTIWVPWTSEHSIEWENNEKNDTNISFTRRNLYFEPTEILELRDKNWQTFCNLVCSRLKVTSMFPDLGFAVLHKKDKSLIGLVRLKLWEKSGYLKLTYALIPQVRNQKFGSEIIETLTTIIIPFLDSPIAHLTDAKKFYALWYLEGKKIAPDYDQLLELLAPNTTPFKGITAAVDILNFASLALLVKAHMQPIEVTCNISHIKNDNFLYDMDILFQYPAIETTNTELQALIAQLLSRDENLITIAHNKLKHLFSIENDWIYLLLNRTEKEALEIISKTSSTITFSMINRAKRLYKETWPQPCFIN